jgi:hypothetical protein
MANPWETLKGDLSDTWGNVKETVKNPSWKGIDETARGVMEDVAGWKTGYKFIEGPVNEEKRKEEEARKNAEGEVARQKDEARKLQEELARKDLMRKEALDRIKVKESQLKDVLKQGRADVESAIEKQLDQLLAEAGFQAGEARMGVGEGYADRGLLRSSFASKGIENVNLAEQQEKANQRLAASAAKRQVGAAYDEAIGGIERRREAAEQARTFEEFDALQNQAMIWDETALKNKFAMDLDNIQVDAETKRYYTNMIGSTIGNLGGIFASFAGKG